MKVRTENVSATQVPWASLVSQQVKKPPANAGDIGDVGLIPEEGMDIGQATNRSAPPILKNIILGKSIFHHIRSYYIGCSI